jgi:hypothetical protein
VKGWILLVSLLCLVLSPGKVPAQSLSGNLEWFYISQDSRTDIAAGPSTSAKSNTFRQRYTLYLTEPLYPKLQLRAGGLFEKTFADAETDGTKLETTFTRTNPLVELTLGDRFFGLGTGYYRNEDTSKVQGSSPSTNIRDTYNSFFTLRPVDIPTLNAGFTRTYNYDAERRSRDTVTDLFSLSSEYFPRNNIRLRYQYSYNNNDDRLRELGVTGQSHVGRVEYNESFGNRLNLSATYNIGYSETETSAKGTGEVPFQRSPVIGLFAISDTPANVKLDQNLALIDGNPTAGAGINIGQSPSFSGDTKGRNIGLDFAFDTELNALEVWVDNNVAAVANSFSWDVFTSRDNQTWTFLRTVSPATFGPIDNRFEIRFPNVTTRYIKVVTRPLPVSVVPPPGTDISNILVTEVQAFQIKSAAEVRGKTSSTVQTAELGARAMLLDYPSVYYDFYGIYRRADPGGSQNYDVTNSLTVSHQFSRVFSGTARVGREDSENANIRTAVILYSASLSAVPLPTLSHTLQYSGRTEEQGGKKSEANSFTLNNYARLYEGIDVNLSGGASFQNTEDDRKTDSRFVTFGATVTPRTSLTLGTSYTGTKTFQTGGGREDVKSTESSAGVNVSWQPFNTLYLNAAIGRSTRTGEANSTNRNFSLNYSPFQGGALQFNFQYFEGLTTPGDRRDRNVTPSVRWRINPWAFSDVSYQISRSTSYFETSKTDTFTVSLRMYF